MHIHEYQAKMLLNSFNIPTPDGRLISNITEASSKAEEIFKYHSKIAIKAQIYSGGRGKAGGIKFAQSVTETTHLVEKMLQTPIKTAQTGGTKKTISKVYLEALENKDKELYLSIILNTQESCWTIIASNEGGVDIEEIAERHPNKIIKINVYDILKPFHIRRLIYFLGIPSDNVQNFSSLVKNLMRVCVEKNVTQAEINPLALVNNNEYIPLDAKIEFDDNALFKHNDILQMLDPTEFSPLEIEAKNHDLNYIKINGSIGCMVNGAGLAMATMDTIELYKGKPANFLDVGGSATADKVEEGFRIIMSDPNVKGILINIFGGIMKCDTIALGIIQAAKSLDIKVPIVVRLDGTNADAAKEILSKSDLNISIGNNLDHSAKLIIKLAKSTR